MLAVNCYPQDSDIHVMAAVSLHVATWYRGELQGKAQAEGVREGGQKRAGPTSQLHHLCSLLAGLLLSGQV